MNRRYNAGEIPESELTHQHARALKYARHKMRSDNTTEPADFAQWWCLRLWRGLSGHQSLTYAFRDYLRAQLHNRRWMPKGGYYTAHLVSADATQATASAEEPLLPRLRFEPPHADFERLLGYIKSPRPEIAVKVRRLMRMVYIDGLTLTQAARAIGWTLENAVHHRHRALAQIRAAIT